MASAPALVPPRRPPRPSTALTAAMTGESTLAPPSSTMRAAASLQGSPPPSQIPVMLDTSATLASLWAESGSSATTGTHTASRAPYLGS